MRRLGAPPKKHSYTQTLHSIYISTRLISPHSVESIRARTCPVKTPTRSFSACQHHCAGIPIGSIAQQRSRRCDGGLKACLQQRCVSVQKRSRRCTELYNELHVPACQRWSNSRQNDRSDQKCEVNAFDSAPSDSKLPKASAEPSY